MLEYLLKSEKNSTYISSFEVRFNEDVKILKKRSVQTLIECHPLFFRHMVEFDDWDSAMHHLQENKKVALQFWNKQ
jgi:predicted AlkP superfamily phosphohydrolase/phosphomutase